MNSSYYDSFAISLPALIDEDIESCARAIVRHYPTVAGVNGAINSLQAVAEQLQLTLDKHKAKTESGALK